MQITPITETEGTWVSSNSVAALGSGPIDLYDLSGAKTGEIPGDYQGVLAAADRGVFAAIESASGQNAIGTTYRVWDGTSLSSVRDGAPLNWSRDGSRLAVLEPFAEPGHGPLGEEGHVSVVDSSGNTILKLNDWVADWFGPYDFSLDGRFLAACFQNGSDPPTIYVVDLQTTKVSDSVGKCGYSSWTVDDTLYSSFPYDSTHVWTPNRGVGDPGFPPETVAFASTDGKLATWSGSDDATLRITVDAVSTDYPLSGAIENVFWSPDGMSLVAVSSDDSKPTAYDMTIIPVGAH